MRSESEILEAVIALSTCHKSKKCPSCKFYSLCQRGFRTRQSISTALKWVLELSPHHRADLLKKRLKKSKEVGYIG